MYKIIIGQLTIETDNIFSAKLEARKSLLISGNKTCHIYKNDVLLIVSENDNGNIIDHEMQADDNIYYGLIYELS